MTTDEFTMPDGTHIKFTKRTRNPAQEGFEIEMTVPPKATATPPHIHPTQIDEFNVVSGAVEVLDNGTWHKVSAGETHVVRPGSVHTYRNRFDAPCVIRNVHDPADSFQEYLDRLGLLIRERKITAMVHPATLVYMAILFNEHKDAMVLHSPILRLLFDSVATAARTAGVKVPRVPTATGGA
ncbi:cupin domain-containing protein [Nocardia sp. NBC_00508]|uniref:cupin domain-containing protein n=1 Tax=Nocardia sp. NBC_00508 TaxID=2975992 RepID=UPI002E7FCCAE|nr:cupin domain-containing protein [Nocardia sp. NBC_00508]WUD64698.1 cupin domain-containing protein [Nocardia sp. NBC_00508]